MVTSTTKNPVVFVLQDWKGNRGNTKGRIVAFLFRIAQLFSRNRVSRILGIPYTIFYKMFVEYFMGIDIPPSTSIGSGLKVFHGQSLVIHRDSVIGPNCILRQCVTIGSKGNESAGVRSVPMIGAGVEIGANACVLGPITIGDNVTIGAGSIVITDIPAGAVVVGNPGRVIKIKNSQAHG